MHCLEPTSKRQAGHAACLPAQPPAVPGLVPAVLQLHVACSAGALALTSHYRGAINLKLF